MVIVEVQVDFHHKLTNECKGNGILNNVLCLFLEEMDEGHKFSCNAHLIKKHPSESPYTTALDQTISFENHIVLLSLMWRRNHT